MLVPIAVSRPSPSVLRPLSLVGRVGFVVRCGWLAFNQQIDPAFDMAYAGDRLEGRGPGPQLSVPMPLLPYIVLFFDPIQISKRRRHGPNSRFPPAAEIFSRLQILIHIF